MIPAACGGRRKSSFSAAAPLAGRGDQARAGNGKSGKVEKMTAACGATR